MAEEAKQNPLGTILGLVVAGGFAWYFFGGGLQGGVAKDFEKQYNMAKSSGTLIDVCVRAGLVAEGYLQAQDQSNYQKWKAIQARDCAAAGITN